MKTLRIDAWLYWVGMAVSALAVAVGIPAGLIVCILLALDLL